MVKRSLKQQAREAEKKILEENQGWYNDFMQKNYPDSKECRTKQKSRNNRFKAMWISIGSSAVAIAAVIVTLVLLWPTMFPGQSGKRYSDDKALPAISNLTELNADLNDFAVAFGAGYNGDVRRIYDTVSGDTLYYRLDFTNNETSESITIFVYTNKYYTIREKVGNLNDTKTDSVGGFTVKYNQEATQEEWSFEEWIFVLNYYASTEYKGAEIFIEYEQLSFSEESNFFNFFEQTFLIE